MPYTGETLHHYTSTDALMAICKNLTLRATKLGYFSDGGELEYGLTYADRLLQRKEQETSGASADAIKRLKAKLDSYRGVNIFVCSFTKHGDQLGQWRGYGKYGQGYSLAFDAGRLTEGTSPDSQLSWSLKECLYDSSEQYGAISAVIEELLATPGATERAIDDLASDLVRVAATLKHPSFQAEDEVRLISTVVNEGDGTTILYRPGGYTLVPYIEVHLHTDAIQSVRVGPTSQLSLSIAATAGYLRAIERPLPVYGTTTTFREW